MTNLGAVRADGIATATLTGLLTSAGDIVPPDAGGGTAAFVPEQLGNPPVAAAAGLHGQLVLRPPLVGPPPASPSTTTQDRAMAGLVLTMPTPVLVAGRPQLPRYHAVSESSASAIQGPGHIRAIADPDPVWDPATSGWFTPPPASGVGDARWSVQDLPDPNGFPGGWYWLGDPSSADGTLGITAAARQWSPDRATAGAPSWHSFFPYKPSVRSAYSYLPGGQVVHHPKGVHFNSHFIEHMWLDWGAAKRQPFSWVLAAMINAHPAGGYEHFLLDSGRNPDVVGFPRITDYQTATTRSINDGLEYRNLLSVSPSRQTLCARLQPYVGRSVFARVDTHLRPKMYFGVFNGGSSLTGAIDPGARRITAGTIDNGPAQEHRFYVLGRGNAVIGQRHASHVLVFELRFWHRALTVDELDEQYGQLASTYRFNSYRGV